MTKKSILKFLNEHHALLESKFSVEKIGLFGSYVNGTATNDSDIDFYVVFKKKTLDNMTGLWLYLEDAFGKKVDLLHYHPRLRDGLKDQIEKEVQYA